MPVRWVKASQDQRTRCHSDHPRDFSAARTEGLQSQNLPLSRLLESVRMISRFRPVWNLAVALAVSSRCPSASSA